MTVKLESASRPGQVVPNDGDVTVVAGTDQRANDTDRRRSSMRKAIDDISSLTESAEKKKAFKGIRFQMKVLFGCVMIGRKVSFPMICSILAILARSFSVWEDSCLLFPSSGDANRETSEDRSRRVGDNFRLLLVRRAPLT